MFFHEFLKVRVLIEARLHHFISSEVDHIIREVGLEIVKDALQKIISNVVGGVKNSSWRASVVLVSVWHIVRQISVEASHCLLKMGVKPDCSHMTWVVKLRDNPDAEACCIINDFLNIFFGVDFSSSESTVLRDAWIALKGKWEAIIVNSMPMEHIEFGSSKYI